MDWKPRRIAARSFVRLAVTVFLFNAGYSIYMFLFNFYLAAQGWHEDRMGALTSATVLGGLAGAIPVARLANHWGAARAMAATLAGSGLLLALRLLVLPFPAQWLLAALSGLLLCGWTVLIFPLIADLTQEADRPRAFQLLYGLATAAGCVGALAGGALPHLLQEQMHLSHPAEAERFALLLACLLIFFSPLALPRSMQGVDEQTAQPLRLSRKLLLLLAASALWAFLLGAINPFAGIYFQSHFHLQLATIGNYFFVVQAVVALVLVLAGLTGMGRQTPLWLWIAAQILVAACCAALALHSLALAQAAYLLFMVAQQLAQPALQQLLLADADATGRNRMAAANALLTALAQAAAAQTFGLVWSQWGYARALPLLALAPLLLAMATAAWLRNPASQNQEERIVS